MNTLAALNDAPWFLAMSMVRALLILAMAGSFVIQMNLVRGTRARYRAATVLRTVAGPVTILTAVELLVCAAAGDWWNAVPPALLLIAMPLYFKHADEDNWWNGRWGKIRAGLRSALTRTSQVSAGQLNRQKAVTL